VLLVTSTAAAGALPAPLLCLSGPWPVRGNSAHLDHAAVQGCEDPWALGVKGQALHPVALGLKLGEHCVAMGTEPNAGRCHLD